MPQPHPDDEKSGNPRERAFERVWLELLCRTSLGLGELLRTPSLGRLNRNSALDILDNVN